MPERLKRELFFIFSRTDFDNFVSKWNPVNGNIYALSISVCFEFRLHWFSYQHSRSYYNFALSNRFDQQTAFRIAKSLPHHIIKITGEWKEVKVVDLKRMTFFIFWSCWFINLPTLTIANQLPNKLPTFPYNFRRITVHLYFSSTKLPTDSPKSIGTYFEGFLCSVNPRHWGNSVKAVRNITKRKAIARTSEWRISIFIPSLTTLLLTVYDLIRFLPTFVEITFIIIFFF